MPPSGSGASADRVRAQDPQLAAVYHAQMVERGATHTKALCVVAARLAERAWATMSRDMPYVVCDTNGHPVTAAEAKAIIAAHFTVPEAVRRRRRSKKVGKAPHEVLVGHQDVRARSAIARRPSPQASSTRGRVRSRPADRLTPFPLHCENRATTSLGWINAACPRSIREDPPSGPT